MRHAGRLAYSKCKESVGPLSSQPNPNLTFSFLGSAFGLPSIRHLPAVTLPRGQWPHTHPKVSSYSFEAGQNQVMVAQSPSQAAPRLSLPPPLPQLKRRTVTGSVCAGVGGETSWVLGLRPGRQMNPQSWSPGGARQVCGEDAHPGSWS